MDPHKAMRKQEIEALLLDPRLTPERKAALLSEKASLENSSEAPASPAAPSEGPASGTGLADKLSSRRSDPAVAGPKAPFKF